MKKQYSSEPGTAWHLAKGTYSFCGPPQQCRGELAFINSSDSKVKVNSLHVLSLNPKKGGKTLPATLIAVSARVPAHGDSRALATLQLPLNTAPGHYQACIECGKDTIPLEVEVLEHQEAMIEPTHLRVQAACGDTISCQLAISNLGNVPISFADVGMIWFRESDWIGRTLVYALRESIDKENYQDFANRLLHNFREDMIPPTRILLEPGRMSALAAGKSIKRTLRLPLPSELKKGRRYLGFIKIGGDRIWLELFCTGTHRKTTELLAQGD